MTGDEVRDDWIPKEDYTSEGFARLEAERLWPRVWQIACREEEIPNVGDFATYDIVDESFVIVRTSPAKIKAFFNVCMHRGRRLTEGCGRLSEFVCRYHGWRYDLEGRCKEVVYRDDWGNRLKDEQIRLRQARVGVWGGFVFINMDENAEPLEKFLAPIIERCGQFELEKMRFRWYRSTLYPANWKTWLEGFDEAYHAQQTHPQLMELIKDDSRSRSFGLHSNLYWQLPADGQFKSRFGPADRLHRPTDPDHRKYVLAYHKEILEQLGAQTTPRTYAALQRLLTEVPADASPQEVLQKARQFQREAAEADQAGWPNVTEQDMADSGFNWHVFPNFVFQHLAIDGLLAYRARPNGTDPHSCVFDVWSLMRFAPGAQPRLERKFVTDWREIQWGRILTQDFVNLDAVQRGMRSRAFVAARTNPLREGSVSNFHRALRQIMR
jgi:phenylpropionate dioxygenase-like ring-hydroxylating dioxygenase large terminal subunit